MIQNRVKQRIYLKDIATELGVSTKTVSRALKRGSEPKGKPGRSRGSLLEPHYDQIHQMLADDIWNARVIWRELCLQGFSVCESTVRNYVQFKRPLRRALKPQQVSKCKVIGLSKRSG